MTGVLGPHLGAILGGWVYYLTVDHGSLPLNKSSSIVGSGLTVDTHAVHPTEKEKINGESEFKRVLILIFWITVIID